MQQVPQGRRLSACRQLPPPTLLCWWWSQRQPECHQRCSRQAPQTHHKVLQGMGRSRLSPATHKNSALREALELCAFERSGVSGRYYMAAGPSLCSPVRRVDAALTVASDVWHHIGAYAMHQRKEK